VILILSSFIFCLFIGGCVSNQGVDAYRKGDYTEALREFRNEGDPSGDFAVGVMHYKGEGVSCDSGEAVGWFRRAAEQGSVRAKEYLKHIK
jgi:TPR repeat protein